MVMSSQVAAGEVDEHQPKAQQYLLHGNLFYREWVFYFICAIDECKIVQAGWLGDLAQLFLADHHHSPQTSRVRNIRWIEPDDWDAAISVNLTAVYTLMQAVIPGLLLQGRGTLITVSSLAAVRPNLLGGAPYGAAKAAVRNLMGFMHGTFRNNNIRCTTILPGEVNTPIMDTRVRPPTASERAAMVAPDDVARAILLVCTLPQGTTIEELVISPTLARDQGPDIEISRWLGAPAGTPGAPSPQT